MRRLCALLLTLALIFGLFATMAIPAQAARSIVAKGIDVSVYQGNINWNAVKNSGHGDFAILRAYCYGKDTAFDTNYANAKAAGVPVGAYVYVYGNTVAAIQSEINALLSVIKGKQFEYPIYVDFEDESTYQYNTKAYNANLVKTACQMLEDAGFYAGVYTYLYFTNNYLDMSQLTAYTTWIADYNSTCNYTGAYDMWQYSCDGTVNGIDGYVDTNYCYTDLPSQIAAAGKNGYVAKMQKFDEEENNTFGTGVWNQQWHITTGKADTEYDIAQEFRPADSLFKGVQLYMKVGLWARVKIGIGTTKDDANMFSREYTMEGNQHEGWYSFDFQQDVTLTPGELYYLQVRIIDSNSYGLIYANVNTLADSCPIRVHIRNDSIGFWEKIDKCIGFNMLTEYGNVQYPFPTNGNTMMIYDGDSTDNIVTHYFTGVSLDRQYRREGTASLKLNCTDPDSSATVNVGGYALIPLSQAANLSKYNYISYQLYLPKDMTTNSRFQVNFVTNPNGEDGFNSLVNITGWKQGWHTVTLEKSKIGKATADADWSKIYKVRLVWLNDDRVAEPTCFFFDNLHATVETPSLYPYQAADGSLVLHDGEQFRATMGGYNTHVYPSAEQVTEGSKSIYMGCTHPAGQASQVGGMAFITLDNAVDMTDYDEYSFDLYIGRNLVGAHRLQLTFSSDDCNLGFEDYLDISDKNQGWLHAVGFFDDASLTAGQEDAWDSISTIRITWMNDAQDTEVTEFYVDNFKLGPSTADKTAAKAVSDLIDTIPDTIAVADQALIASCRAEYNGLTDIQKELVTNVNKLISAEETLNALLNQKNDVTITLDWEDMGDDIVRVDFAISEQSQVGALELALEYDTQYLDWIPMEDSNGFTRYVFAGEASSEAGALCDSTDGDDGGSPKITFTSTAGYHEGGRLAYAYFRVLERPENGLIPFGCQLNTIGHFEEDTIGFHVDIVPTTIELAPEESLEIVGLEIAQLPEKTTFYVGDAFERVGLKLRYVYNDGSYQETGITSTSFDATGMFATAGKRTVRVYSGSYSTEYEIEVLPLVSNLLTETMQLHTGEEGTILFEATPLDATESIRYQWNSSNKSVATVQDGVVTAVGLGTTEITLDVINGAYRHPSNTCLVTVSSSQDEIDKAAAKTVSDLINTIPSTVTLANKALVEECRTKYNGLTDTQKALVTNLSKLTGAEQTIANLEAGQQADQAAAKTVSDLIATIPASLTLENKALIVECREKYTALTDGQKALVTNLEKLTKAEETLAQLEGQVQADQAAAKAVSDLINTIPSTVTLEHRGLVEEIRGKYEDLTDSQKAYVSNYSNLELAEEKIAQLLAQQEADKAAAKTVDDMIASLPKPITLVYKAALETCRAAYDKLTDSQKALVNNYSLLEQAEKEYAGLLLAEEEKKTAKSVEGMIASLPNPITLSYKASLEMCRIKYNTLSDAGKTLVSNYALLEQAEAQYQALLKQQEDDKAAAKLVEDMLVLLPETVTAESKAFIALCRQHYDSLTPDQQALIKSYDRLVAAEEAVANLPEETIPAVIYGDVNTDEKIDAKDALLVLKAAVGKAKLTQEQATAAEVDGKDGINAKDALEILKFSVGKIKSFPVEVTE